ncbi:MAG: transcriptional repressor [Clostridia bacterium]|nr:transcriptional repressor [Clostridia bacterium]
MKKERHTEQKKMVENYLKNNSNKHLNIEQIYTDLKSDVGKTTVYRIINSLIEKGCVTKIPLENKQGFCYKYNEKDENCNNHYHLICEKCNKLYHFKSEEVAKVSKEVKQNEEFDIDNNRIVFYGVCKNCKK